MASFVLFLKEPVAEIDVAPTLLSHFYPTHSKTNLSEIKDTLAENEESATVENNFHNVTSSKFSHSNTSSERVRFLNLVSYLRTSI